MSEITKPFLSNLERLNCPVQDFQEEGLRLKFTDLFGALRFLELVGEDLREFVLAGREIHLNQKDLRGVRRIISEVSRQFPEEMEPFEVDMNLLLNQMGNLLFPDDMPDYSCGCDQGLGATVAPENKPRLALMFELIRVLLPRELGTATLTFEHSSGEIKMGELPNPHQEH